MADALLQVVIENATNLIQEEYRLLSGFGEEIEKLSSTLLTIRAVLKDAEGKGAKNEQVRIWLKKLKNVAYDADDILDKCATKALQAQVEGGIGCSSLQVRSSLLPCFEQVMFRHDMGNRVKKIVERIDAVAAEKEKFGLTELDNLVAETRQTDSFLTEPKVYGREEDLEKIVESLVAASSNPEGVSVYAIIGMGGLGKTALAKLAYNDERVHDHFELKIWVCVSQDFDESRLVKAIIESISISENACTLKELDPIKKLLQEKLSGKRFLLVLDDVWNEEHGKWESLKSSLTCGANGSKIIVTTRTEKVANIVGALSTHPLTVLSENDCWSLFKQRAFGGEPGDEHKKLVAIGKEIVKKCAGVPLAAKALGGMMESSREESDWSFVRDSEIWDLTEEKEILPALRLSYNFLPSNLKPCFAYCSIFPKDYEFEKETLILLWMANGFLSSERRSDLEDVGQKIFKELWRRSFFQDVKTDDDGNIIECKMHDLVHDLAQWVMKDECYSLGAAKVEPTQQVRHSPLICESSSLSSITEGLYKANTLRSFILHFPNYGEEVDIKKIFMHCRCLRVLDLRRPSITKLSNSLGNLIHLRYLNLSSTQIKTLPESTSRLQNLQTLILKNCYYLLELPHDIKKMSSLRYLDMTFCWSLTHIPESMASLENLRTLILRGCDKLVELPKDIKKMSSLRYLDMTFCWSLTHIPESMASLENLRTLILRGCNKLVELPKDIKKMSSLRYLHIHGCHSLTHMPAMIGQLSRLETLTAFICSESGCRIGELKGLNLRGELEIKKLNNVRNKEDALEADLLRKESLRLLDLSWEEHDGDSNSEEVLQGLQPHHNLKRLLIRDYAGIQFPSWMMDDLLLPNQLVEISLINCRRCACLPPLAQLGCLKRLTIKGMGEVSYIIGKEIYAKSFPSLEKVKLEDMPNLEKWSLIMERRELLPCLRKLSVRQCPKLTMLPCMSSSLQNLKLENCNATILESVANLSSLLYLRIEGFEEVACFPQGMLSNLTLLKELDISNCQKLTTLSRELDNLVALNRLTIWNCKEMVALPNGLGNLSSLRWLNIGGCDNLRSLSEGLQYLTALQDMRIDNCPEMNPSLVGIEHLTALRTLRIKSWPRLARLPQGLQHLTALEELSIRDCSSLTDLPEWLDNLASLRSLDIWDCPNMKCLPEALQRLTALQRLWIGACPILERRKGEDWHKIKHVPNITIIPEEKEKKKRGIHNTLLCSSSCLR